MNILTLYRYRFWKLNNIPIPIPIVFKKLNWFTVNQLICYYTLIRVFKVRQSKSPEYLANILCLNSRYGRIKTRKQTLTLASNSFTHRGVQLWNKLPSTVRNEERIGPFKRLLRQWIFNHIQAIPDEAWTMGDLFQINY